MNYLSYLCYSLNCRVDCKFVTRHFALEFWLKFAKGCGRVIVGPVSSLM